MNLPWKKASFSNISPSVIATPLFIRHHFDPSSYDVYLTDLTSVWSESLDRRNVIRRALNENTVIDPSEDRSQLQMLLNKVEEGLSGLQDTDLQIYLPPSSSSPVIRVLARLPAPFEPLEWLIYLKELPKDDIKTVVVAPALRDCVTLNHRLHEMEDVIKQKDKIISRLMDKIEETGMDMVSIFPSMSRAPGLKSSHHRQWVTKNVSGVAPYLNFCSDTSLAFCLKDFESGALEEGVSDPSIKSSVTLPWWELLPSRLDHFVLPQSEPIPDPLSQSIQDEPLEDSPSGEMVGNEAFDNSQRLPDISSSPLLAPDSQSFPLPSVPSFPPLNEETLPELEIKKPTRKFGMIGGKAKPTEPPPTPSAPERDIVTPVKLEPQSDKQAQKDSTFNIPVTDSVPQSPKKKRIGLMKTNKMPLPPMPAYVPLTTEAGSEDRKLTSVGMDTPTANTPSVPIVVPVEDKTIKLKEELRHAYANQEAASKKKKRRF